MIVSFIMKRCIGSDEQTCGCGLSYLRRCTQLRKSLALLVFFGGCVLAASGFYGSFSAAVAASAAADDAKPEAGRFVRLFDGKTLAGWTGAKDAYGVENGAIVCKLGTSGNLLTEKEYGDFVFRFEFKLTEGANNGLGIRCPLRPQGNLHLDGIELQILDHRAAKYANIKPYQFHGSVYGIAPAKKEFLKPLGEWNQQEVTVRGRRIQISLNGAAIVDVDLDEATKNGTLDGAEHPGLKRVRGHIGFLGHGDRVEFRAIEIKEL
jgi:hypothetical protein